MIEPERETMADDVLDALIAERWPETGKPTCPHCECQKAYRAKRSGHLSPRWRCAGCHRDFTLTSGTNFASSKLSTEQLAALFASNGEQSIVALAKTCGVNYRTAAYFRRRADADE